MIRKWSNIQSLPPAIITFLTFIGNFAEPNLSIAFASLLPCPWLYHDIGKSLNLKPSPNPLYQQWIETYITDELEQQIREEGALVNQLYRESDETDKKKNARCLPHQCSYGS